ncbi:MAG: hypothetical protein K8T26_15485 [Lentisphaerae bacterium]|nr:hypothetical protein [Lentisphaerota bacterium]
MRKVLQITMAVVLAVGVAGCGGKKEKASHALGNKLAEKMAEQAMKNNGQEGTVKITDEGVNIQSEQGAFKMSTGKDLSIPDDFPKAVPVYTGAKVAQVVTTPESAHLILNTADAQADVVAFYKRALDGAGWTSQMAMQTPDGDMLSYQKDKETMAVMVSHNDDGTMVTVTYGTNWPACPFSRTAAHGHGEPRIKRIASCRPAVQAVSAMVVACPP